MSDRGCEINNRGMRMGIRRFENKIRDKFTKDEVVKGIGMKYWNTLEEQPKQ